MKVKIEKEDIAPEVIEAIGDKVIEKLKRYNDCKHTCVEDTIFDVKGLAEYLKVSPKWIYERTHINKIPHFKLNGHLRFRKKKIDRWFDTFNVPAVSPPERILRAVK